MNEQETLKSLAEMAGRSVTLEELQGLFPDTGTGDYWSNVWSNMPAILETIMSNAPAAGANKSTVPFEAVKMFFSEPVSDSRLLEKVAWIAGYFNSTGEKGALHDYVQSVDASLDIDDSVIKRVTRLYCENRDDYVGNDSAAILQKLKTYHKGIIAVLRSIEENKYYSDTPFLVDMFSTHYSASMDKAKELLAELGVTCLSELGIKLLGAPGIIPDESFNIDKYFIAVECFKMVRGATSIESMYAVLKHVYKQIYGEDMGIDVKQCMSYLGLDESRFRLYLYGDFKHAAKVIHNAIHATGH